VNKAVVVSQVLVLGAVMAGCTHQQGPDPTIPPVAPSRQVAGSTLPARAGGYTAMGSAPATAQTSATYARDADPSDLVVITLDANGHFGTAEFDDQQWYGASRCGTLWKGDPDATPRPTQMACVTVLTDGVMTSVSAGKQTAAELAELANAIYSVLS
jgi:hypothetical protein